MTAPSSRLGPTTLAALGVVFGDIGTSPLYAVRECFHGPHAIPLSPVNILGVLSLIVWSLIGVISIKYLVFILRADNKGEGGILALMALASPRKPAGGKHRLGLIVTLGLFGAALLYGDGVITPAITVLSAVEGLKVATPLFEPYIVPTTALILIFLFAMQKHGTAQIGRAFGPVILVWFLVLGAMGVYGISQKPDVLMALNPVYAWDFFRSNSWHAFVALGSVFLVVTGGEALYADLGHFGRRPIQLGWFAVALPGLLLQYFGQGALLLLTPEAVEQPFYRLAPTWALYPLVVLATAAAIIASQALITGAFSLSQQAVRLGYLPRLSIKHTSAQAKGQIYLPFVNWALLVGTLFLVFAFRSSSNLAAAYGIAVTATMSITTILAFVVMRRRWRWSVWVALPLTIVFLVVDFAFLGANSLKIRDGGWVPLAMGAVIFFLMVTWKEGRHILAERLTTKSTPLDRFMEKARETASMRVPGVAVFMTAVSRGTPPALAHNLKHNRIVHETVVIVTVVTDESPHVAPAECLLVEALGDGFHRVIARCGFMDSPDVPQLLQGCAAQGLSIDLANASFVIGRETLVATEAPGMAMWRERIFAFMTRNAQRAPDYFQIPAEQAIEIGAVVEL